MDPEVVRIVEFLDRNRIRATYGAVGEVIGLPARTVGSRLGDRCPLASWVVSAETGEPTGYLPHQKHPKLRIKRLIIRSGAELTWRMKQERRATSED